MKKTKFLIVSFILIATLLFGCGQVSEDKKLAVCGSFSVPGMFCHDLKGGSFSCSEIEKDSQGRVLFLYETTNITNDQLEKAYVICQKIDSDYVYFYEDVNYIVVDNQASDIETLKKNNDWDLPLEASRMSKRKIKISQDLYIMTESKVARSNLELACEKEFGIQKDEIDKLLLLDVGSNGKELFWLSINKGNTAENYYILVNSDCKIAYLNANDISNTPLSAFKQNNGWSYG